MIILESQRFVDLKKVEKTFRNVGKSFIFKEMPSQECFSIQPNIFYGILSWGMWCQ